MRINSLTLLQCIPTIGNLVTICMIYRSELICCYGSDSLFFREVGNFKSIFLANNYLARFFDKILRKFFTLSSADI